MILLIYIEGRHVAEDSLVLYQAMLSFIRMTKEVVTELERPELGIGVQPITKTRYPCKWDEH